MYISTIVNEITDVILIKCVHNIIENAFHFYLNAETITSGILSLKKEAKF